MTVWADNVYRVGMRRLALMTLPTWLRRPLAAAVIYAGVMPLARLLHDLRTYRGQTRYRLGHNGQVCRLRGLLNDEFDPVLRRIRVEDGDGPGSRDTALVWRRETGRPVMVPGRGRGAAVIHREGFGGTGGYDFWLAIPRELAGTEEEQRLRAVTDIYKLASRRYAVNYI